MTVIERPNIDYLTRPTRMYIGGEFVEGSDAFETRDPATGEVLAEVPIASRSQVDAAVDAARSAFKDGWRDMAPPSTSQRESGNTLSMRPEARSMTAGRRIPSSLSLVKMYSLESSGEKPPA